MELSPRKKLMASILAGVGITAGAAGIAGAVSNPGATAPAAKQVATAAPAPTPVTPVTPAPAAETPGTETTDPNEPPEAPGTAEASDPAGGTNKQDPSYTGSVTAPQDQGGAKETDENAALAPLAKISAADATSAALAAVPGTAGTATLENENGNVVYSVIVTTSTGTVDVKVDAGNGKVLAQDAGGNETDGGNSATANG
jgi:hypothetical protein